MNCCYRDGHLTFLRTVERVCRFFGLRKWCRAVERRKLEGILLRHPYLRTIPR